MLVFNEGVPGSGKSYDAMKNHILPAIKAGRKVYARLNGLEDPSRVEKIATYLKMPAEQVRELLHHMPSADVFSSFQAVQDEAGEWSLPERFHNALIVIDEVHDFYIGGTREQLPKPVEQFFALHRHFGCDVLTMTQFYKRIHPAIRYRIERKAAFQKLSVLGKKGEDAYRVTRYTTVAPDRYEKIGGETHQYDAAIFPLYKGIAKDEVQTEVYSAGRLSLWKTMLPRAAIIVPLGLFSVWFLLDFFTGGGAALVKTEAVQKPAKIAPQSAGPTVTPAAPNVPRIEAAAEIRKAKLAQLTPEQRYVWELSDRARIRLSAVIGEGMDVRALVEWVDGSQVVIERLSLTQLRALGILCQVHPYGVRLQARDEALIATAWPLDRPLRDVEPRLYDTSGARRDGASVSEHPHAEAPATPAGLIAYDGAMPVGAAGGGK